jgi:hypothetical protein
MSHEGNHARAFVYRLFLSTNCLQSALCVREMDIAQKARALRLNQEWVQTGSGQWTSEKGLVHYCSVATCQFSFVNEKNDKVCAITEKTLSDEPSKKKIRQLQ